MPRLLFFVKQQSDFFTRSDLRIVLSAALCPFNEILKGLGRNPINGKKKGSIKMHTIIDALKYVQCLIYFGSAATQDHTFLKEVDLE